MLIKIHKSYREVVAICDSELLGKVFEEGKGILDIRENFYSGEKVDEKRAEEIIQDRSREDATFNIVGKKSIQVALKTGIIAKEGIKYIQGIPYALVLL